MKLQQYFTVYCPYHHRHHECWFDGYEFWCEDFDRPFKVEGFIPY